MSGHAVAVLFGELVELPEVARAQRLAELEVSDPVVARELRVLLDVDARGPDLFGLQTRPENTDIVDGGRVVLAITPGQQIGPYRLQQAIGHGGMGTVWLAHDERLGRQVALKFLRLPDPAPGAAGAEARRAMRSRFLVEARAAASIDHPNVAAIYDVGGASEDRLYIAMAYCAGGSLADRVATGAVPWRDATRIAGEIAAGLTAAHERGVIHRDLKPANVLFDTLGGVRLADFGIARMEGATVTASGVVVGTLAYLAPELIRGATADARSDLWALGVTLYEMLRGERPFTGDSHASLMHAVLHGVPASLEALPPDVPRALLELVSQLLSKNPADRPGSAAEVAQQLEAIRERVTTPASREPSQGSSSIAGAPTARVSLRGRALIGLSLAAAAAIAVLWQRRDTVRSLTALFAPSIRTSSSAGQADDARAFAVIAVGTVDGDSLGDAVSGMISAEMARTEGTQVIAAARLRDLMRGTTATELTAAQTAGATQLVDGTMLRTRDEWRLELRRTETRTGRVLSATRISSTDVLSLVDSATAALRQELRRPTVAKRAEASPIRNVEAWRLYEAARRAHNEGAEETAIAQLRGALALDSTFAIAAWVLAAIIGDESPEYLPLLSQATRMLRYATPLDSLKITAAYLNAINQDGAGEVLDSAIARDPGDLDAHMMRAGPALAEQADVATALRSLQYVYARDSAQMSVPGRLRCYACEAVIHMATVYEVADSLPAFERNARAEIARDPTARTGWQLLAHALERDVTRHREMDAAVDSAIRYGAPDARLYRLRAATRRGDRPAFERALAQMDWTPQERAYREPWARAVILRNVGQYAAALTQARLYADAIRRSDRPADDKREARALEGAILLEMGRAREAAALWSAIAQEVRPELAASRAARKDVFFQTLTATARYEAGDTTGLSALADSLAVRSMTSGFSRDRALHHHVRGLAMLARGRRDAALAELRRAIVFPISGFTRTNWYYARALEDAGRRTEAEYWYRAASRAERDGWPLYQNPIAARAAAQRVAAR
jgi:serine/threonine protein kinase/TolB-like protein/tetratricopeptide (TPR) repeat protein